MLTPGPSETRPSQAYHFPAVSSFPRPHRVNDEASRPKSRQEPRLQAVTGKGISSDQNHPRTRAKGDPKWTA